jgi:hypothetical protein
MALQHQTEYSNPINFLFAQVDCRNNKELLATKVSFNHLLGDPNFEFLLIIR